jgi:glycosyltransferase involved in cell wall biosynthesis
MVKLSALLCVHNEEARLPACLARLAFCDEIVVVADRCRDRSETIARDYGARVVTGIFPLESQRKQAGIEACAGEWIFEVDADELADEDLARSVREVVDGDAQASWYQVPVDNYVGDQLVRRGWGGSFGTSSVARLYRRGAKFWKPQRVHPGVTFEGVFGGSLQGALHHMVDDDIADMVDRLNRYTALRAIDLAESGKKMGLADNVFRGVRRFYKCYVTREGHKEGQLGFLIALMAGLYPILSCLKARELLAARAKQADHFAPALRLDGAPSHGA